MSASRNAEPLDPRERFALYRLCDCPTCGGRGQLVGTEIVDVETDPAPTERVWKERCSDCRGEGRIRQELATCESPEAVGVALVTLGREREWEGCAFGLLDRMPEGKETGTWLVLPWLPSARNVSDAGRTLARSKRQSSA